MFGDSKTNGNLKLAKLWVLQMVGVYLHLADDVDGQSHSQEDAQFSSFFFLSK